MPKPANTPYEHDRYIDARALRYRVVFCLAQIYNLEAAGRFPRAYRFGPGRRAWSVIEVNAWMQQRLDARLPSSWNNDPPIVIHDDDRFLPKPELRDIIPYSPNHLLRLEQAGTFPRRVSIGEKRVA